MDAISAAQTKKGWQLIHRCTRCGAQRANRITFDTLQPDDLDAVIRLMQPSRDRKTGGRR
jgi:hypothetical protein